MSRRMIELVIKLPEENYERMKFMWKMGSLNPYLKSIAIGTPLPKGHGALKDADKLAIAIAMVRDKCNYYGNEYEKALFQAYDFCVDEIIDATTIIEADEEGAEE